jgi:sugar lactone lactonase YvrE
MKPKLRSAILLTLLGFTAAALAQERATIEGTTRVQELGYKAVPNFFKLPKGEILGETQGIATNSKGHIFVYFRDPQTRLWEFDQKGNFVKEIGKGYYGFVYAHSLRVDARDNIWAVDEGANLITKFDPTGNKVLLVLGYRPPVDEGITTAGAPTTPAENYTLCRPTDVAWDAQDNIFVADGYCNNRVVKYDKYGKFIAQVGKRTAGSGLGEFNLPHAIQVDKAGNVYVADRGNARYVVLDNSLNWKTTYNGYGSAWSDCISTEGAKQYLFVSNSNPNGNPPGSWAQTGQIYKAELDGTVIGKFGHAGKVAPGFQVVHMMDCRNPNTIFVGEIESWRSQKFVLDAGK